MMKLCVLGNSHVAALKLGWDKIRESYPQVSIRFFAAPGSRLQHLNVDGSRLIPANKMLREILSVTSDGEPMIETSDYDAFLGYGLSFDVGPIDQHLSEAVFDTYCRERATRNNNFRLARKLMSMTKQQIFMGHIPLQADNGPIWPSPYVSYEKLFQRISAVLSESNITLLSQPEKTITSSIRTKNEYTKGSVRLKVSQGSFSAAEHADDDVRHMNGLFGAIYLADALDKILASVESSEVSVAYSEVS